MNTIEQYKETFTPIYKRLASHYQNTFVSRDRMAQHLFSWIQTLQKSQLPLMHLNEFTDHLISEDIRYRTFPPNPGEYITAYREWLEIREQTESIPDSYRAAFDKVYRTLSIRYEGLWGRNSVGSLESHKAYWLESLYSADVPEGWLEKAVNKVRSSGLFRIYPPNIDQFIELAKIAGSNMDVPTPEEAYSIAISTHKSEDLPPLVRHVRAKFGYKRLIEPPTSQIKSLFDMAYRESLELMLRGDLIISQERDTEDTKELPAAPLTVSKAVDDILNDIIPKG